MAHLRLWVTALAVCGMGHLALCLSWPPECAVEVSLPCSADREAGMASRPARLPVEGLAVPFWDFRWEDPIRSGEGVTCTSLGPDGVHAVAGRLVWGDGANCRLEASWKVASVPFHLRAFGVLFGARAQMEDALTTWLEAWSQGAVEAEAD